jgi:UPF0755 protein
VSESPERTPEEREAARLEREQRRAQRWEPVPEEIDAAEPEPPALVLMADDQPEPFDDDDDDDEDEGEEPFIEAPAGTRRVSGLQRSRERRDRSPVRRRARGPRAPRGPRGPGGAGRTPHSLRGRIASVVAIILAIALIWFLVELFQPFAGSGHGSVVVDIPAHASSSQIGDLLQREGVISSSLFFELRATLAGERGQLRSGRYHLKLGMSYGDVLAILTKAPTPAKVTDLTIIEGRTRHQINDLLRSEGIHGSYLAETRHSRLLNPVRYGAPRNTPSLEGFLFPSTYQLREPIKISALVSAQLQTFKQRWRGVNLAYARGRHLSPYEVLIIASMIEAEASTAHDRPLVASVIYNRLARGMALQLDATTRYATGNYTRPLTVSQLNSPSPYNTRNHKGLPPTPIDNPGMASIEAAAHPAHTNYLFFVVKPCGNGEQAFTASFTQFQKLQAQYDAARAQRGGRSPAHC